MYIFVCIGQFLVGNVIIDADYNLMKLGNHKPLPVYKAAAWPLLGVEEDCWYAVSAGNQATGIIEGV